jgi:death-on-curing protein
VSRSIIFPTVADAIACHEAALDMHEGEEGMRDLGLLESALAKPQAGFGDEYYMSFPWEMAAALLHGIARNHAFVDANKRTAMLICMWFLNYNGFVSLSHVNAHGLKNHVERTSRGAYSIKQTAAYLRCTFA